MLIVPSSNHHAKFYRIAILLLLLTTFFLSSFLSKSVFERLPHLEDEIAYLYQAKIFARGNVIIETPTPRLAYWQPFVIDYEGNRFSKYPPAWSFFLAFGVLVNQTWIVNGFFAMLSIAVAYRLGKDMFDADIGFITALLMTFSPIALLLNASLMGHTATLFWGTCFLWAVWHMGHQWQWAIFAGLALGIVILLRPLTGIAFAFPTISWAIAKFIVNQDARKKLIRQMIIMVFFAGLLALLIPIYQFLATDSPTTNLYTLVWEYDQLGFGNCCGRNGHTLQQGIAHARWDLSLANADVFGWVIGKVTPEIQDHLRANSDYFPLLGLSFILFPIGGIIGLLVNNQQKEKTIQFLGWWFLFIVLWLAIALIQPTWSQNPQFSWVWVIVFLIWLVIPFYFHPKTPQKKPTSRGLPVANPKHRILLIDEAKMVWILLIIPLVMIVLQMTYWIGSQRYSTRYYFEALACIAIISALPIVWLMRYIPKKIIYTCLLTITIYSFFNYSLPRIQALRGYNLIQQNDIDAILKQQINNQPLLVIVNGNRDEIAWRAMGSLMAVTSPYLDSEIVVAWDYGEEDVREQILARFPNRQIVEMVGIGNEIWFKDKS